MHKTIKTKNDLSTRKLCKAYNDKFYMDKGTNQSMYDKSVGKSACKAKNITESQAVNPSTQKQIINQKFIQNFLFSN